jgi:hypothetical protein
MGSAYKPMSDRNNPLPPLAGVAAPGGGVSLGDGDGLSFNLDAMRRAAHGNVNPQRNVHPPPVRAVAEEVSLRDEAPAGARRPRGGAPGGAREATQSRAEHMLGLMGGANPSTAQDPQLLSFTPVAGAGTFFTTTLFAKQITSCMVHVTSQTLRE